MNTENSGSFLLFLHWGYNLLGAIIHLAVKGSLSAMHTPAVHAVWEQSQNARQRLSSRLKSCCGSFINSHRQLWQTAERGTELLSEVGGTDGATTEQNWVTGRHVVPVAAADCCVIPPRFLREVGRFWQRRRISKMLAWNFWNCSQQGSGITSCKGEALL